MNWDAVGALSELIGAVAVIITLIYLAVQVRQNTLSNQNSASQTISAQYSEWLSLIIENESVAHIYRLGQQDLDQLTDEEKIRYGMLLTQLCRACESQYQQHRTKMAPEEMWESTLGALVSVFSRPGGSEWWDKYGDGFSPAFREVLSTKLKDVAAAPKK